MFCPSCGKEVSGQARACPSCGQPFQGESSPCRKSVAWLLCRFLPGTHRFYVGKIGSGLLFIMTLGGAFVWWIIDLINIDRGVFEDDKGRKLLDD
jgi:hypothetical protein